MLMRQVSALIVHAVSMHVTQRARTTRGVTLIELMVVIAVAVIVAAIAVPNLSSFFINNRLSAAANEFVAALSTARSEAIKRGTTVTMRRSGTSSRDWSAGWEMFVDLDANGTRNPAAGAGEDVLRVGQPVGERLTMFASAAGASALSFLPSGRLLDGSAGQTLFVICHDNSIAIGNQSRSRAVIAAASGLIRTAESDAYGRPVGDSGPVNSCTNPAF